MRWSEVRASYPDQWLVIEALEAQTTPELRRSLERVAVVERCADGWDAFQSYRRLHEQHPEREYYYIHTGREQPDIRVQNWAGTRGRSAANTPR